MFSIDEIKELIRAVDDSTVGELEIKGENKEKISIRKESVAKAALQPRETVVTTSAPAPAPQPAAAPVPQHEPTTEKPVETEEAGESKVADDSLHKITSPMVGTFYRAPSPDADPYVNEGDKVKSDSIVCIVEAMKLMNELEAEVEGEIVEILVENGELVEYGQPLFLVKTK